MNGQVFLVFFYGSLFVSRDLLEVDTVVTLLVVLDSLHSYWYTQPYAQACTLVQVTLAVQHPEVLVVRCLEKDMGKKKGKQQLVR